MFIEDLISEDLPLSPNEILEIANAPENHYYSFKTGGRIINAPRAELKLIQCWISDFIRAETPPLPEFVTAYEVGSSILANAQLHRQHNHLLCLDIREFFHSCTRDMVFGLFSGMKLKDPFPIGSMRLPPEDADLLTKLATYHGSLSTGSPCSPAIANRIALPLDHKIISSLGTSVSYSRYSDDMCISSDLWLNVESIVRSVSSVLERGGFVLNTHKTRCYGRGNARRVTGLYITPDGAFSIGSTRKKRLNKMLYSYLVKEEGSPHELLGLLNFCIWVEPDYASQILAKYANYGMARRYGGVVGALRKQLTICSSATQAAAACGNGEKPPCA